MRHNELTRASMIAAAESFADVTAVEQQCYDYTHAGIEAITSPAHAWLTDYFRAELAEHNPELKAKYVHAVVHVALQELHYPYQGPTDSQPYMYAWSGRQRAACAAIAQRTWADNKLCPLVDKLIKKIEKHSKRCTVKVKGQLQ